MHTALQYPYYYWVSSGKRLHENVLVLYASKNCINCKELLSSIMSVKVQKEGLKLRDNAPYIAVTHEPFLCHPDLLKLSFQIQCIDLVAE